MAKRVRNSVGGIAAALNRAAVNMRSDAPTCFLDVLESRLLLSAGNNPFNRVVNTTIEATRPLPPVVTAAPAFQLFQNAGAAPDWTSGATGLTPTQIRNAYGINQITFGNNAIAGDGTGETIAIIDAFDDPNIASDLAAYDTAFGIPAPPSFTKVSETGSTTNLPTEDSPGTGDSWALEVSLDVEWAHTIAPAANILLVEASSTNDADLFSAAVNYARNYPGVVTISMSFGSEGEFAGETSLNSNFLTPSGHIGETFFASTGDSGEPGGYPAYAPSVVAVGGTTLSTDGSGDYLGESGWSDGGGGISTMISQPAFQKGVVTQSTTNRTIPDVSFDANPSSGVPVYDSWDTPASGSNWVQVGGTSFSSPAMAAITAIADQGRSLLGLPSLDGVADTLPRLYAMYGTTNFHDITSGNNGFQAGVGYDLVTGLGSPVANQLVPALVAPATATPGTPSLAATSDTGASNSDDLTNLNNSSATNELQFLVSGTLPGATVTVYANGTAIGSALASDVTTLVTTNGAFTLTNGTHAITARQSMPGQVTSAASSSLSINVDTTPPTVTGQTPTGTVASPQTDLRLTFSEAIDPASFSLSTIASFTGPSGDLTSQITGFAWSSGNTVLDITFNSQSTVGNYQLILAPQLRDVAGNSLAGAYTAAFTVDTTIYSANMTTNPGWTFDTGSQWAYGIPTGSGSFNKDPSSAHTGSDVVGYNLAGNYARNITTTLYATTPSINITNFSNLFFSFWRWLGVRSSATANVQVSYDNGTTWTSLWTNAGATITDTAWTYQQFTLSPPVGATLLKFRFGLGPTGTSTSVYPGWNIDDVTVFGSPLAAISGQVFVDANANGVLDNGEQGLNGVTVYIDTNNNGVFDSGEPSTVTSGNGNYTFNGLAANTYTVREVTPANYITTPPTAGADTVFVSSGASSTGQNLGDFPTLFTGLTGTNTFTLSLDAAGANIQISQTLAAGSPTAFIVNAALLSTLTFNAGAGSANLTIDFSNGNPVPAGGLNFTGGSAGANSLQLIGQTPADAFTLGAAQITGDNASIAYANVQNLALATGAFNLNFPGNGMGLTLESGAALTVAAGSPAKLVQLGSLAINAGASFDLNNNDLIVANTPVANLYAALVSGQFFSTSANASDGLTTLGTLSGAMYLALNNNAAFDTITVNPTDTVIKYTYRGDAYLSGRVTLADFSAINGGFLLNTTPSWLTGDYNNDGVINYLDYAAVEYAYTNQQAPLTGAQATW